MDKYVNIEVLKEAFKQATSKGNFMRLPCKVGDKIYRPFTYESGDYFVQDLIVTKLYVSLNNKVTVEAVLDRYDRYDAIIIDGDCFDDTVFVDIGDAEAKVRELNKEKRERHKYAQQFPCRVGTKLYAVEYHATELNHNEYSLEEYTVTQLRVDGNGIGIYVNRLGVQKVIKDIGGNYFFTKEEAERELLRRTVF